MAIEVLKPGDKWTKSGNIYSCHPYRVSWLGQQRSWAAQKSLGGTSLPEHLGSFPRWQDAVRACEAHRAKLKEAWEPTNREAEMNKSTRA